MEIMGFNFNLMRGPVTASCSSVDHLLDDFD